MGRIRKNVISWAIAVGLTAWGSAATAQSEELSKADRKALAQIAAAAEAGDCALVLKGAVPFVERRNRVLPNEVTGMLYAAIAACHIEAKRSDEAYKAALAGTALPQSAPQLWYVRLYSEIERKRWTDVVATLEAMTREHSAALNDLPIPAMWELLDAMKEERAPEARTRVLKLLASDFYAPSETFGSNDGFRLLYAQDRIAAGDKVAAGPVIATLEDPSNIATASLDPRMRGYLASTDLAAAATRRLARHRDWVAREPDRLRPLIAAAKNLRQLGRAQEALDLLRSAEPRLDKLTESEDSDHLNWWWNELALTYETLHRPDEAVEAYRNGSKASEDGVPNVSQLINLALAQLRFGRPRDALATIALRDLSAKGASPYGMMLYRRARACALHLVGRGGEAKADVDYVVSHEKDAPVAVTELHLCLEDMDAAAASAIRRLEDPEQRPAMLLEFSDYELAPPPLATDRNARSREALKKREDVRAAITRAGGTRRFNVAEA